MCDRAAGAGLVCPARYRPPPATARRRPGRRSTPARAPRTGRRCRGSHRRCRSCASPAATPAASGSSAPRPPPRSPRPLARLRPRLLSHHLPRLRTSPLPAPPPPLWQLCGLRHFALCGLPLSALRPLRPPLPVLAPVVAPVPVVVGADASGCRGRPTSSCCPCRTGPGSPPGAACAARGRALPSPYRLTRRTRRLSYLRTPPPRSRRFLAARPCARPLRQSLQY